MVSGDYVSPQCSWVVFFLFHMQAVWQQIEKFMWMVENNVTSLISKNIMLKQHLNQSCLYACCLGY